MLTKKLFQLSNVKPSIPFLVVAVLIGGFVRLAQVIVSPVPLNDGGLFYSMTRDLMENNYRLPDAVSYNNLGIPFAYPPLAFYIAGGLVDLTGWDLFNIIRILPAIFTVLSIPAFYLLAREIIKDEFQLILATLIFSFIPTSFDWLIMGGGLTRAPAFFFALLNLLAIYRLYTRKEKRYILYTAMLAALTILTHPETALHTAASALVLFLFLGRSKSGIISSLLVSATTILLIMPWLGVVLARHGLNPFLTAGQTGWYGIGAFITLFQFDLTHEYAVQIISVLGLLGLFRLLVEKKFLLPVWLLVVFISDTRSAPLYVSPIITIMAAYFLFHVLQDFQHLSSGKRTEFNLFSSRINRFVFALLLAQWIFSAFATTIQIASTTSLTRADLNAFQWIKDNTSEDGQFMILTGVMPLSDPASEWFPALTKRKSIGTVQGHEWDSNRDFDDVLRTSSNLQQCVDQSPDCIATWLQENHMRIDYIYIHTQASRDLEKPEVINHVMPEILETSGMYELIYETNEVAILQVK